MQSAAFRGRPVTSCVPSVTGGGRGHDRRLGGPPAGRLVGHHPSPVVEPFSRSGRDGSRCRLRRMHHSAGRLADDPSVSGCRSAGPVRTRWGRCRLLMPWQQRVVAVGGHGADPLYERRRIQTTISGEGVNTIRLPRSRGHEHLAQGGGQRLGADEGVLQQGDVLPSLVVFSNG